MRLRRHGIVGGVGDAGGADVVHFGLALWPYDLLLRFGYDLPEHEHRWEGRWFDDRFEVAAFGLRASAAKLLIAIGRMDSAVRRLDSATQARAAVEEAPLEMDLVVSYLRAVVDGVAEVMPCCFGSDGRALAVERGSLDALMHSSALRETDEITAGLVVPPTPLCRVLARDFATHAPELYTVSGAAGDAPALPRAAASALAASASRTLAAADEVDAALHALCRWLDALLDRLIVVVCERAEDGPELAERWAEPDWSVLATTVPVEALRGHLPS